MKKPLQIISVRKIIFNTICLFTLALSSHGALAACQVPVCDINGTIKTLESSTPDQRSSFLGGLYEQNRGVYVLDVLNNLHEFSKLSYELSKRLNDKDTVLFWSVFLRENSIYGLLKVAPFDPVLMKALFDESRSIPELNKDRSMRIRYDALQRWRVDIETIFDVSTVYALYDFLDYGFTLCKNLGDADYIIREALAVLDILGKRLTYLYPFYEGIYKVTASCTPDAASCAKIDFEINQIVLMNSLSDLGIYTGLNLAGKNFSNFIFKRANVRSSGQVLYSQTDVVTGMTQRTAETYVRIDNRTQDIEALVRTPEYPGTLRFKGSVIYSPIKFYVDEGLQGSTPEITGRFGGLLGTSSMNLIIKQKDDGSLMATCTLDKQNMSVKLEFTTGQYIAHRGIIQLTGFSVGKAEPYKMTIAYRKDAKGAYHWSGGYFSILGNFETVTFNRIGAVDPGTPTWPMGGAVNQLNLN